MPVSFWIFLIICIASFVVAIDDHSEEWKEFKELKGAKKWWKGLKIFTLWFVCVGSLIGTLVLGWESIQDDKKDAEHARQFNDESNKLAYAEAQLISQSNELQAAGHQIIELSNSLIQTQQTATGASNAVSNLSRHLTYDQKVQLFKVISAFPKGTVSFTIPQNVPDGKGLAIDLAGVFNAAE
jgi:hypothetical protein